MKFFAKTFKTEGKVILGQTVKEHCIATGFIAKNILKLFPFYSEQKKSLFTFLAACHDVGKISIPFQLKIALAVKFENVELNYINDLLTKIFIKKTAQEIIEKNEFNKILQEIKSKDSDYGYHSGLSALTIFDYFKNEFHIKRKQAQILAKTIEEHHGFTNITLSSALHENSGGKEYYDYRIQLIKELKQEFYNFDDIIEVTLSDCYFVQGLIVIADWIASSEYTIKLTNDLDIKCKGILEKLNIKNLKISKDIDFTNLFKLKNNPRSVQQDFIDNFTPAPGIYIIEAPMGIGKTEIALYAAYKTVEANKARGFYFALPSQITSNAIYLRVNEFLKNCGINEESFLLHSNAKFFYDSIDQEIKRNESLMNNFWYNKNDKKLFYPYGVGTIDQILMSVLYSKFNFLRIFSLSQKVIIFDEVHCYDLYTSTLLKELIKNLENLNCTIIILSATLTTKQKKELLSIDNENFNLSNDYPLLTFKSKELPLKEVHSQCSINKKFTIIKSTSYKKSINSAIEKANAGLTVFFIVNTVKRSQDIYKAIANQQDQQNFDLILVNSNFTASDRQNIETKLIENFGKQQKKQTNKGYIVVATQILEQSLDIDSDYLITELAVTDSILQRIGRCWRFDFIKRSKNTSPQVELILPNMSSFEKEEEKIFKESRFIYHPYLLYRSYKVFEKLTEINIPHDIKHLIEQTYQNVNDDSALVKKLFQNLEQERFTDELRSKSNMNSQYANQFTKTSLTRKFNDTSYVLILLITEFNLNNQQIKCTLYDNSIIKFNVNDFSHFNASTEKDIIKNTIKLTYHQCIKDLDHNENFKLLLNKLSYIFYPNKIFIAKCNKKNGILSITEKNETSQKHFLYNPQFGFYAQDDYTEQI